MISFTPVQLQLIAANAVGFLRIFTLCAAYAAEEKRTALMLNGLSLLISTVMYAVKGLWLPAFVCIGSAARYLCSACGVRRVSADIAIMTAAAASGIWLDESIFLERAPMFAYLPIVSMIFCELYTKFISSRGLLAAAGALDSALWLVYHMKFTLLSAMVSNLINIMMPAVKIMVERAAGAKDNAELSFQGGSK